MKIITHDPKFNVTHTAEGDVEVAQAASYAPNTIVCTDDGVTIRAFDQGRMTMRLERGEAIRLNPFLAMLFGPDEDDDVGDFADREMGIDPNLGNIGNK